MAGDYLPSSDTGRRFSVVGLLLFFGTVFVLGVANCKDPVIRFSSDYSNDVATSVLIFIPFGLFMMAFWLKRWWVKVLVALAALPVALVSLFLGGSVQYTTYSQASVAVGRGRAVPLCGEDNMGAWHFKVRYEVPIFPGLNLVREYFTISESYGPLPTPSLAVVGPNSVRFSVSPEMHSDHPGPAVIQFKPFAYF